MPFIGLGKIKGGTGFLAIISLRYLIDNHVEMAYTYWYMQVWNSKKRPMLEM